MTTKYEPDEKFERFVTVSSGTGMKLSNQRGFRSNEVITDFDAVGFLSIDPSHVSSERLKNCSFTLAQISELARPAKWATAGLPSPGNQFNSFNDSGCADGFDIDCDTDCANDLDHDLDDDNEPL